MVQSGEYRLTYREAYEAFYLLAKVGSETVRRITLVILFLLGAALTVGYAFWPRRLDFQIMAFLCVVTFVAVVVAPTWKAKRGAKKVERTGGFYRLGLGEGFVVTPDGQRHPLAADKWAKAFETKDLFVLRPSRVQTFCLPKRILVHDQISHVRHILTGAVKNFVKLG